MEKDLYILNPFFRINLQPELSIDLLLEGTSYGLDEALLAFIRLVSDHRARPLESYTAFLSTAFETQGAYEDLLEDLLEKRFLVTEQFYGSLTDDVKHWVERGWLEALVFHLKTRDLKFSDRSVAWEQDDVDAHLADVIKGKEALQFWKTYDSSLKLALPPPAPQEAGRPLESVLLQRRSNRPWKKDRVDLQSLANIFHFANVETVGLRTQAEKSYLETPSVLLNSAFSALETYYLSFSSEGVPPGLYHYEPDRHCLALVKEGLFREEIATFCIGQQRPAGASGVFIISTVWERYMYRYQHSRAYRTLLTNVAELAQKYILLATAEDMSTFLTPAIRDREMAEFMGMDEYEESPIYVVAVG